MTKYSAVNWDRQNDEFTQMFFQQNIQQFWIDTEIPVSDDLMSWVDLSSPEKEVYKRVLGGLTLLDTRQGADGMPLIAQHVEDNQRKAVLAFMQAMEMIHAKSYSTIFTTLARREEIDEIFNWVEENKYLQTKAEIITEYYRNIRSKRDLYMAMVASVFLESWLFYSGFYYPLFLAGQGKMMSSGEMINLIIRDEAIHGVYIGMLAQEVYESLNTRDKNRVKKEVYELLEDLYVNELSYTDELYSVIGLQEDVKKFLRYNANKALNNLGLDHFFPEEDINPIVLNGLRTDTKQHDFFSLKGSSYGKAANVEKLTDEDFKF